MDAFKVLGVVAQSMYKAVAGTSPLFTVMFPRGSRYPIIKGLGPKCQKNNHGL